MKRLFSLTLLLSLVLSQLQAGFFSDLFKQAEDTKERQFETVEEEVISADEYYDKREEPEFIEEEKVFSDTNVEEYTEEENFIKSKNIFLSYVEKPKKVYINQHFTLTIKAVVTTDQIKSISTQFVGGNSYKVLNSGDAWREVDEKSYVNSYTFKLTSAKASLPDIKVVVTDIRGAKSVEILKAFAQKIVVLKEDELFSHVLAREFHLLSHHEKRYDEKSNIILLEINATDANLEDFQLSYALREGIDSIKEQRNHQRIFYFAVVPNYQKELKFKYFNLNTNKFNRISFPIVVADSSVSTQTDLNPQKSRYFFYKIIILLSIALILLLSYMRYKKSYLLFLALIIAIYTIYTKLLTNNLVLAKDIAIRILPTENSTIFFKTGRPMEVKVLLKKNGYTKVLLPNTKIGWIKDADISKN
jgi:hypothetical protein